MKINRFGKQGIFGGVLLLFLLIFFLKPVTTAVSTTLFLTQVLPLPVKPQEWVTRKPKIEAVEFFSDSKKVVGQIFRPDNNKTHPALIATMGVRTSEKDKLTMANFAQSLSRMGFVVLVANLEDLEKEKIKIQGKEVFLSEFRYLESLPYVDKKKVSFVGFSVGASVALKAAEDPRIAHKIHAFVFFGGYFDLQDYLSSLLTKTAVYQDEEFPWEPREHVVSYFQETVATFAPQEEQKVLSPESQFVLKLFEAKGRQELVSVWPQAPEKILKEIEALSPSVGLENLKTRLFILHDRGDRNVSFVESRKLNDALPENFKRAFLEVSLFEHVRPQEALSWPMVGEIFKLFFFLNKVFLFLL